MFRWASNYDKLLKIHFLLKQSLSTDLNKEWLLFYAKWTISQLYIYLSWHVTFWWDEDVIWFVLEQHA